MCLRYYVHSLEKHGAAFKAMAEVVQIAIQNGEELFQVEYNEADISANWPSSEEELDWNDL